MTSQVYFECIPWGKSLDIVLNIQDFDNAYEWLEKNTLIGYFLGRTPPESMLKQWIAKHWNPNGIHIDGILSLTKGFCLFWFSNPS